MKKKLLVLLLALSMGNFILAMKRSLSDASSASSSNEELQPALKKQKIEKEILTNISESSGSDLVDLPSELKQIIFDYLIKFSLNSCNSYQDCLNIIHYLRVNRDFKANFSEALLYFKKRLDERESKLSKLNDSSEEDSENFDLENNDLENNELKIRAHLREVKFKLALISLCARGVDSDTINFYFKALNNIKIFNNEGENPLFKAIKESHFEVAKILILNNTDVDFKDYETHYNRGSGYSIIELAAKQGNEEIVDLLMQVFDEIEDFDIYNYPLIVAAQHNHMAIVKKLLSAEVPISYADYDSYTALSHACKNMNLEMVKFLLDQGAGITGDIGQDSSLFPAIESGSLDVVRLLFNYGASVQVRTDDLYTPLMVAVENGYYDIAQLLLEQPGGDAIVNEVNDYGDTSLILAVKNNHIKIVELLISKGARVGILNEQFESALSIARQLKNVQMITILENTLVDSFLNDDKNERVNSLFQAIESGCLEDVRLLLDHGASVKECPENLFTPLMAAVDNGYYDIVQLLLEHPDANATINEVNYDGNTALILAVKNNEVQMVKLLISKGAKVDIHNKNDETALSIAEQSNNAQLLQILENALVNSYLNF